jgi:hypothetical protein
MDLFVEQLEQKLDSYDLAERKETLELLVQKARRGRIDFPSAHQLVNLHCHSFFSYNARGYSPSKFAWLARRQGLTAAGIVDFDVLDGLEEFLEAGRMLNLRTCVGLETRVFIPELADKQINSPGEPGVAYYMAVGFTAADLPALPRGHSLQQFLLSLRQTAQLRNRQLMQRVNSYLAPVELDHEKDVLPLTPAGNPTERHLSLAYARKAHMLFRDTAQLVRFWADKLAVGADRLLPYLPEGIELINLIRAKTMKQGGVGYVQPDKGSFPPLDRTNDFFLAAGAIPTFPWLDGFSEAEKDIERLLGIAIASGTAAVNIVPDRNFTPGVKDQKLANLYSFVNLACKMHLPVIVGTEMNSPGQKFVDDFASEELAPLVPVFLKGAYIIYAHSALQRYCRLGYTSRWAKGHFPDPTERNDFFEEVGRRLQPVRQDQLAGFDENSEPGWILEAVRAQG